MDEWRVDTCQSGSKASSSIEEVTKTFAMPYPSTVWRARVEIGFPAEGLVVHALDQPHLILLLINNNLKTNGT